MLATVMHSNGDVRVVTVPLGAHIDGRLPCVLDGRIQPGRVLDPAMALRDTPEDDRATDSRGPIGVLREP